MAASAASEIDSYIEVKELVVTKDCTANCSGRIKQACRIVIAISKHIVAQQTLAGGDEGVGVDESAPGGIVITALEIVQP